MSEKDLTNEWAWKQVEAMVDRSLGAAEARRMRRAMDADPELAAAVDRAAALRRELGRLAARPVPQGLPRRLMAIADPARGGASSGREAGAGAAPRERRTSAGRRGAPRGASWWALAAPAAAAAVLVVIAAQVVRLSDGAGPDTRPPAATPQMSETHERAVQEFQVAMGYLQRSAAVTSDGVTRGLTAGLREALEVSRSAVLETEPEPENGG